VNDQTMQLSAYAYGAHGVAPKPATSPRFRGMSHAGVEQLRTRGELCPQVGRPFSGVGTRAPFAPGGMGMGLPIAGSAANQGIARFVKPVPGSLAWRPPV